MEIYLCHMVMFRLIEKVHIDRFIQNTHAYYWSVSVLGIVLTILFSYYGKEKFVSLLFYFIEEVKCVSNNYCWRIILFSSCAYNFL